MKDESIAAKLLFAKNALTNALGNENVKNALNLFGYGEAKLLEGQSLQEKATDLHEKQVKEYGEQFAATDELNQARKTAHKDYIIHLKIARIALRGDKNAVKSLGLSGKRKESLSGWISQTKTFYVNAISSKDVIDALSRFGITQQKLEASQDKVNDVESLAAAQLIEKGEAQAATVARDQALDELDEWMADFIAIARIALEDQPQLIEMLGIVDRSSAGAPIADEEEEPLPEN